MKELIILIGLCILLLSGCNSNIGDEVKRFCESKGFNKVNYIMDYNYESTKVECGNLNHWYSIKYNNLTIFNMSCDEDFNCKELDKWGKCKKGYYNYTCS